MSDLSQDLATIKAAVETLYRYELTAIENKIVAVEKVVKQDISIGVSGLSHIEGVVASGVSTGIFDVEKEVVNLETEAKAVEQVVASGVSIEVGKAEGIVKGIEGWFGAEVKKIESLFETDVVGKLASDLATFTSKVTGK